MVIAGGIGAWFGTGIVVHWPRQLMQRAMAIALLITAGFMAVRMLASLSLSVGTIGKTARASRRRCPREKLIRATELRQTLAQPL